MGCPSTQERPEFCRSSPPWRRRGSRRRVHSRRPPAQRWHRQRGVELFARGWRRVCNRSRGAVCSAWSVGGGSGSWANTWSPCTRCRPMSTCGSTSCHAGAGCTRPTSWTGEPSWRERPWRLTPRGTSHTG